jgi:hypothetical protein
MRVKKVFKSKEVAHIWAQQKQAEGRNAQGNIYFDGKSIFSCGSHFEMARFVTPEIVLRTSRTYSVTTRKHLNYVANAVSDKTLFTVPSFEDHTENALYLAKEIRDRIDSTGRARSSIGYRLQDISGKTREAYAYLFEFKNKIGLAARKEVRDLDRYFHKVLTQDKIDALKVREAEKEKRDAIRYAAERARREEAQRLEGLKHAEHLENWKASVDASYSYGLQYLPVALRINGDNIETSHGATVPLKAARELWDKLTRKEPLHGLTMGDYTVTGFDGSILMVGCHKIPVKEVLRMARALNWLDKEAAI